MAYWCNCRCLRISTVTRSLQQSTPAKDVDGFHVVNAGRLAVGEDAFVPCTPLGCLMLLKYRIGDLSGKNAVVIGRSNIVGKPMAQLLLAENCTVTIAHSRTADLADVVRRADIVVAAVGRAEMVKGDWLKDGAVVIDVGINRLPLPKARPKADWSAMLPLTKRWPMLPRLRRCRAVSGR